MKLTKKLASFILALVMVLSTSITAFAAPNDDVIKALKDAKVPAEYITQAENYLKTRTLTADEASKVTAEVQKAADVIKTANVADLAKLSKDDKSKILEYVNSAADAVGLTVSISKDSKGNVQATVKDADGKVVTVVTANGVKQTGVNNTILVLGSFMLVAALASSAFALKKVRA